MKQLNNCVVILDVTTHDYKIVAFKNRRTLIRTLIKKIEREHELRINTALYTTLDDDEEAS